MIFKNLYRRKSRTLLTVLGISIGVFAIILLGALANGLEGEYDSLITGSKADLVLNQPNALDISMAGIDEAITDQLEAMSEVQAVSGMTQGIVTADASPYFFIFGYPEESFILNRFQIVAGDGLASRAAQTARGKPLILGITGAEAMNKEVGDTLRLTNTVFRIIGIYETGSSFEDGGAVTPLWEDQLLLGRQHKVNVIYIQLKDPKLAEAVAEKINDNFEDVHASLSGEFASNLPDMKSANQILGALSFMAVLIGGIGIMNTMLMSVLERTREIGALRALGWQRRAVLGLILREALLLGIVGGLVAIPLALLMVFSISSLSAVKEIINLTLTWQIYAKAMFVAITLGLIGGIYPAFRATQLQPIEALRYE